MEDLNEDCLFSIFCHVSGLELAHTISRVCKQWNRLTLVDLLWKARYHVDYVTLPLELELTIRRETNGLTPSDDHFWRFCYVKRYRNGLEVKRLQLHVEQLQARAELADNLVVEQSLENQMIRVCQKALTLDPEHVPSYLTLVSKCPEEMEGEREILIARKNYLLSLMYLTPNRLSAYFDLRSVLQGMREVNKELFLAWVLNRETDKALKVRAYTQIAKNFFDSKDFRLGYLFLEKSIALGGYTDEILLVKCALLLQLGAIDKWVMSRVLPVIARKLVEFRHARPNVSEAYFVRSEYVLKQLTPDQVELAEVALQHFGRGLSLCSKAPVKEGM